MPDLPAVFDQSIPLPGRRSIPLWAIGVGVLIAGGLALLRYRSGSAGQGAAQQPAANVAGLQTNQFFDALSRQSTTLQALIATQQAQTAQQLAQRTTQTTGQITALDARLSTRLDSLQSQMQTRLTSTAEQIQGVNTNLTKVQRQVSDLAAHEARVEQKQADVFAATWDKMAAPIYNVQVKEQLPNPIQSGLGPNGIMIVDSQGRVVYQDNSKFGTLTQ